MPKKSAGKRAQEFKSAKRAAAVITRGGNYFEVSEQEYLRNEAEALLEGISPKNLTIAERRILKTAASVLPSKEYLALHFLVSPTSVAAKVKKQGRTAETSLSPETAATVAQVEEVFKEETILTSIRCELYEALCKNSKRYKGLVDNIRKNWGLLIGAVAGAVATAVGVAVTVISALVASVLALISAIGIGVFCRRMAQRKECGS